MLDGSAVLGLPVKQRRNLTIHDSILGFSYDTYAFRGSKYLAFYVNGIVTIDRDKYSCKNKDLWSLFNIGMLTLKEHLNETMLCS